jgi:hypothetical protein
LPITSPDRCFGRIGSETLAARSERGGLELALAGRGAKPFIGRMPSVERDPFALLPLTGVRSYDAELWLLLWPEPDHHCIKNIENYF